MMNEEIQRLKIANKNLEQLVLRLCLYQMERCTGDDFKEIEVMVSTFNRIKEETK